MERVQQEKRLTDMDDTFNPVFSSLQSNSEDSGHRNYMDPPSPYRLKADASSEEALKHIRTANTISISPGILRSPKAGTKCQESFTDHHDRAIREVIFEPSNIRSREPAEHIREPNPRSPPRLCIGLFPTRMRVDGMEGCWW